MRLSTYGSRLCSYLSRVVRLRESASPETLAIQDVGYRLSRVISFGLALPLSALVGFGSEFDHDGLGLVVLAFDLNDTSRPDEIG